MEITTNMPEGFAVELKALLEKYEIRDATGWDDGSLILYRSDNVLPQNGDTCFWVEFMEGDGTDA